MDSAGELSMKNVIIKGQKPLDSGFLGCLSGTTWKMSALYA